MRDTNILSWAVALALVVLLLGATAQANSTPGNLTFAECQTLVTEKVKLSRNETCPITSNVDLLNTLYCARIVANAPTMAPTSKPSQAPSRSPTKQPTLAPTRGSYTWTGTFQLRVLNYGQANIYGSWQNIANACNGAFGRVDNDGATRVVIPFLAKPGDNIVNYIKGRLPGYDFVNQPVSIVNSRRETVINNFIFFLRPQNYGRNLAPGTSYLCPDECASTGIWYNIEDGNDGNTAGDSEGGRDCRGWSSNDAGEWTYSVLWTRQPSSNGRDALMYEKGIEDQCDRSYYYMCAVAVVRRTSDGVVFWSN